MLAEDYEGTLIAAPTNIAFCGLELDVLISANLGRWHITRYETGANPVETVVELPETLVQEDILMLKKNCSKKRGCGVASFNHEEYRLAS